MHHQCASERKGGAGHACLFNKVDLDEFLKMIEILTLAPLSQGHVRNLRQMFDEHSERTRSIACDAGRALHREGLRNLMSALGHPEDEVELEFIMREWDVHQRGFLDFDAFLSVVATFLKREELDESVEQDFLKLCGINPDSSAHTGMIMAQSTKTLGHFRDRVRSPTVCKKGKGAWASWRRLKYVAAWHTHGVGVDNLMDAFKLHWPNKHNLTREIAEEMIFDANLEPGKNALVTLDELITCLEMVTMQEIENSNDESTASKRESAVTWRRPSGCHVTVQEIQGIDAHRSISLGEE